MPLPTSNANGQSSIRNFFRPKQPAYVAPPSSSKKDKRSSTSPPPKSPAPTTIIQTMTQQTATTTPSRPANLHPQASISRIQSEHIPVLRRITSLLLPVNYPDSFYARLSDPLSSGAFSRVILWHDEKNGSSAPGKVIGGLVCRPEPSPFHSGTVETSRSPTRPTVPSAQPNALYIQSLVLLSPYRGLGLAAALLDEVVADAVRSEFACESVWAHVWTQNEEGMQWYTARGFARVEEVKKYYHKLQPDSAWIVRRDIGPRVVLGLGGSVPSTAGETTARPDKSVTAAVANLPTSAQGESLSSVSSPGITPPPSSATAPPLNRPPPNPIPKSGQSTPGQSFQNMRPETEWNDLPVDMQVGKTGSSTNLSVPGSNASSRSSSAVRKKRDRAYPAAAFGN
ncbi:acyl-CoA N-acyltransferase [Xylaria bambusicola]|uniref:acyl-CoA N-acyltransferase n=1 Tax=Xylaria bambusicola TaxID=326684 RepID=UPI0020083F73|nr:acyl-CoA N-acyltransferase [Xylaria bambusicola]KAI0522205.1 acyl-CoA N-acyltransferase [Xylaria bambusicola]